MPDDEYFPQSPHLRNYIREDDLQTRTRSPIISARSPTPRFPHDSQVPSTDRRVHGIRSNYYEGMPDNEYFPQSPILPIDSDDDNIKSTVFNPRTHDASRNRTSLPRYSVQEEIPRSLRRVNRTINDPLPSFSDFDKDLPASLDRRSAIRNSIQSRPRTPLPAALLDLAHPGSRQSLLGSEVRPPTPLSSTWINRTYDRPPTPMAHGRPQLPTPITRPPSRQREWIMRTLDDPPSDWEATHTRE